MKFTASTKYVFEFSDLSKNVPHPITIGERKGVITWAMLTLEIFDEPQEGGDTIYFDYTFKGWNCREGGAIIQGRRLNIQSFTRRLDALTFLRELYHKLPEGYAKETINQKLTAEIVAASKREREQIERLLS